MHPRELCKSCALAMHLLTISLAIIQIVLNYMMGAREVQAQLRGVTGISRAYIGLRQWRHIHVPHY